MTTTLYLLFACLLLVVIAVRFFGRRRQRCPQCFTPREEDHPLCRECGWIFDDDSSEDDDYGELEQAENRW